MSDNELIFNKMEQEGVSIGFITRIKDNIDEDGIDDLLYLWLEYPESRDDILADIQEIISDGPTIIDKYAPENTNICWFADKQTEIISLIRGKIEQIGDGIVANRLDVPVEYVKRVKNYLIPSGDLFNDLVELLSIREEIVKILEN